jgi:hypothetical protein
MGENLHPHHKKGKEPHINDLEKTQPLLVQETSEQPLREKPAAFQKHFPVLEEEQLEGVTGGAGLPGCCFKPRTLSPPRPPVENPGPTNPVEPFGYEPNLQRRARLRAKYLQRPQASASGGTTGK